MNENDRYDQEFADLQTRTNYFNIISMKHTYFIYNSFQILYATPIQQE